VSESILLPVTPAAPVAPYLGGKRNLAKRIISRLAAIPHTTYVEPFVGCGGVFLRRPFRAKAEVINDISTDVANLFRVLQRHYVPLMDMLRWQLTSRAEFERLIAAQADTLTDLERAARFLYLQRTAFGGKVTGRSFGVAVGLPARFDVTKLGSMLEEVHERLAGVMIERLPLRRADRTLRSRRHALLPRSALLGLRARLRHRRLRQERLRAARRAARTNPGPISAFAQRPSRSARDLPRLRAGGGRYRLHDQRRRAGQWPLRRAADQRARRLTA
jgi:hypothetical protein